MKKIALGATLLIFLTISFVMFTINANVADNEGKWSVKTPMPKPRDNIAAVTINGKIYVIGGCDSTGGLSRVEVYDPKTDSWRECKPMPSPKSICGAGVINNKIYVVGAPDEKTYEYDPLMDAWVERASIPIPISSQIAVAVCNDELYVCGTTDNKPWLFSYNPQTDKWTKRASLNLIRSVEGFAVLNGKLYLIGGNEPGHTVPTSEIWRIDVYDPLKDEWQIGGIADLPEGRTHLGPTIPVVNGKIYVIGGWDGYSARNTVYIYDPTTNSWSLGPPMPTARYELAYAVLNNEIHAIGGNYGGYGGNWLATNEELSVEKEETKTYPWAWKDDVSFGLENEHLLLHGARKAYIYDWWFDYLIFKDTGSKWYLPWGEFHFSVGEDHYQINSIKLESLIETDKASISMEIVKGSLKYNALYCIFKGKSYIYAQLSVTNIGNQPIEFEPSASCLTNIGGDPYNDFYYVPGYGERKFTGSTKDIHYAEAAKPWIAMWDNNKMEGMGMISTQGFRSENIWSYDWWTICACGEGAIFRSNVITLKPGQTSGIYNCYLYFYTGIGPEKVSRFYQEAIQPIKIETEEASRLAEIAARQAEYFRSISEFLKSRIEPSKYAEHLAEEWKKLGEEILPKPEEIPMKILLKIFKADEVKTMGDLCKGIIVPFRQLSDITFWNEFWMKEELKEHILKITEKTDALSAIYSDESKSWTKIAEGTGNVDELIKILEREKSAIEELKSSLDQHIPAILNEFKASPYQPLIIAKENIKEGDTHDYKFKLQQAPEFIEIKIIQERIPQWWEFWLTRPSYKLELFYGPPMSSEWSNKLFTPAGQLWTTLEATGLELKIGGEYQVFLTELGTAISRNGYEEFKLVLHAKDLGGDNWFTFWCDEGYKEIGIQIILRYGREEASYRNIYASQAQALEDFNVIFKNYLNYCEQITQRTLEELKRI